MVEYLYRKQGVVSSNLTSGSIMNKRKSNFLGISFSTASYQLKKNILFDLVKKTGKDTCIRCKEKIETPQELSIDHKKLWLDTDPNLFWDLKNIGFSHHRCNSAFNRYRRKTPKGTSWCSRCKKNLPIDNFYSCKGRHGRKIFEPNIQVTRECKHCLSNKKKHRTHQIECRHCKKTRKHRARGLCGSCYEKYRLNKFENVSYNRH